MEVNQKDLALILGLSDRRIRELNTAGVFARPAKGQKYDLGMCVKAYIEYKVKAEVGRDGNAGYEEARERHENAKARIAELRYRRMLGELHAASDIQNIVGDMLVAFREKVLSLPTRLAARVVGVSDTVEAASVLRAGLREALEELSEYDPAAFQGGVNFEEDPEEDANLDEDDMPG